MMHASTDLALMLASKYPYLAKLRLPNGNSALSVMTANKSAFGDGELRRFSFWKRFIPYDGELYFSLILYRANFTWHP